MHVWAAAHAGTERARRRALLPDLRAAVWADERNFDKVISALDDE